LAKYRNLKKPERIKDFKEHITPVNKINDHALTRGIALFLFPFSIAVGFIFCGLGNRFYEFKPDKMMAILYFVALLAFITIFLPYLITLWHKRTKCFALKSVLNLLVISILVGIGTVIFCTTNISKIDKLIYWYFPAVIAGSIFIDFIISMIVSRGSFKDFIVDTLYGYFGNVSGIFALCGGIVALAITKCYWTPDLLSLLLSFLALICIYFGFSILFKGKTRKYIINYFNNYDKARLNKLCFKRNK